MSAVIEAKPRAHVETFDGYTIRYDVRDEGIAIDADVFRDGRLLFDLTVKWDGCSHMRMPYLHFDGLDEFEKVAAVVRLIYNDLCDRHGVGE